MKFHHLIALAVFGLALPVHAETVAQQELEYQSAFEGYRPYNDPEIQNWPKVNQLVEEIGGWRVYAREPYENKAEDKAAEDANTGTAKPHQHGGEK